MELRYGSLCAGAKERCGLLNPPNKRLCHYSRRKLRVEGGHLRIGQALPLHVSQPASQRVYYFRRYAVLFVQHQRQRILRQVRQGGSVSVTARCSSGLPVPK